jgi:hypothetical protein
MRKSDILMLAMLATLLVMTISFAGCVTESDYDPLVPITVTGKYVDYGRVTATGDPYRMVCTNLGTYRVYGPSEATTLNDDLTAYSTIPINQTVYVRLAGDKLWWDYKSACYQTGSGCTSCYNTVSCCCNQAAPTPVPTSPSCQCGCRSCGCGC